MSENLEASDRPFERLNEQRWTDRIAALEAKLAEAEIKLGMTATRDATLLSTVDKLEEANKRIQELEHKYSDLLTSRHAAYEKMDRLYAAGDEMQDMSSYEGRQAVQRWRTVKAS